MYTIDILLVIIHCVCSLVIDFPDDRLRPNWYEIGRSDPLKPIRLSFAIKQQNVDLLIDTLMTVSTPSNDRYGDFLNRDEIFNMLKPKQESIDTVISWIKSFNIIDDKDIILWTQNGDIIKVNTIISFAELLLNCQYYDYQSRINKNIISRVRIGSDYHK